MITLLHDIYTSKTINKCKVNLPWDQSEGILIKLENKIWIKWRNSVKIFRLNLVNNEKQHYEHQVFSMRNVNEYFLPTVTTTTKYYVIYISMIPNKSITSMCLEWVECCAGNHQLTSHSYQCQAICNINLWTIVLD